MAVLFSLHDLNGNGVLEESELVQLNSKVAMLHYGKDADLVAVKEKYRALFRDKLDPDGKPASYAVFRRYVLQVLDRLDPDPLAQEMIVEQFAAEARSARAVFHVPSFASSTDQSFLSKISMPSFPTSAVEDTPVLPSGTSAWLRQNVGTSPRTHLVSSAKLSHSATATRAHPMAKVKARYGGA